MSFGIYPTPGSIFPGCPVNLFVSRASKLVKEPERSNNENYGKKSWLTLCAVLTLTLCSNSAFSEVEENQANGSLVGRIAHIEGQLLRYVPDEDDWVLTDQDSPFGQSDTLFSSDDGKAEIIMPNNTMLRIGGDTQVQLIELANDVTEINVSSGTARLYNKSTSSEIKATTPFGDVIMPPDSVCDIYVQETQAEVASLKGSVEFIKTGSTTRQEVIAGSSSIIVNAEQIIASAERVSRAMEQLECGPGCPVDTAHAGTGGI